MPHLQFGQASWTGQTTSDVMIDISLQKSYQAYGLEPKTVKESCSGLASHHF